MTALSPALQATGTWVPLTNKAPASIGLMLLLPDGTVMAHNSGTSAAWYRLTPDAAGHYVNGTWSALQPMHDTRLYYSSQVLRDGRVFVAGGEYGSGYRTGECYDPLTNKWTMAPPNSPLQGISDADSALLPDGRVLVAPVSASPFLSTFLWDPATNTWTTGPSVLGNQNEAVWVKLPDDSLLTVDIGSTNSERYIPALNQWISDATVPVALYDPYGYETGPGFLLPNGKAFFLGSLSHTAIYTPSGTTNPGSWAAGPDIPGPSGTPDAPAVMLPNGKILCAVSPVPTSANHFPPPTTFYEYDYIANSFTAVPTPTGNTLNHPTYYGTMLCLPDGTALYSDFNSQVNCYQPDGSPIAAGKPTITTITQNTDGTFHLVGTQLNGLSEGSSYGDDNQNSTNYPIVRLTSGGGVVYRARTFNWSRTSVQTGATPVSTEFAVDQTVPAGSYNLTVIANGIASDPVAFNLQPILVSLPATATEGGAAVTATVTLPSAPSVDTVVSLGSTDATRATVPLSVTILAGQTAATFAVTPQNDNLLNGAKAVGIYAVANGYQTGLNYLTILDDETAILSVSAGSPTFSGSYGGPFAPSSATLTVTNTGTTPLNWTETKSTSTWLTVSPTTGTLAPGASADLTLTLTSAASTTAIGSYTATLTFVNSTTGDGNTTRNVSFIVGGASVMSVTAGSLNSNGPVGGGFTPATTSFTISNSGTGTLNWTAAKSAAWLTLSPSSGAVAVGANTTVTATINATANSLAQGAYADTITFTNNDNGSGNATRSAALLVQARPSTFDLSNNLGWTTQGEWAWGTPSGAGGGSGSFADPTNGFTGAQVYGVNLGGNYSTSTGGPYYLTTGPISLTGATATKLRFRRWLNSDFQPFATATVDVSSDGTNWTNVWSNGSAGVITDSSWQLVQYDISGVADNKPAVYVRWGYSIGSAATAMSGWNIDDVEILGSVGMAAPTATAQTIAAAFGAGTPVTLSGVDSNVPPSPLTYTVVAMPSHGTVSGAGSNLTYTPAAGYSGQDSFTFTCTNAFNLTSAPATVTLNIPIGAPTAISQLVSVATDTPTAITLGGSDPNVPALPLTFSVGSSPAHGTLSGTAPNLSYTPAAGYTGQDSLTFTVNNGSKTSAVATVSMNIGVVAVAEAVVSPTLLAGHSPHSRLVTGADGNFYGTAMLGGSSGQGTVFRVTPTGVITPLANFYGANGAQPSAGLVLASDGNFYGTTQSGGANNLGTIFRVTSTGTLTTLVHCTSATGSTPKAALVQASDGTLYGSTTAGGTLGNGTIFKLTTAGTFTVMVNLAGSTSTAYGSNVQAPLIEGADGNLYGVCGGGGAAGAGTLFKLTPAGVFTTLVSFTGSAGAALGSTPLGGLVQGSDGTLYGTTSAGGTGSNGTIFKCTTGGTLTTLQNFTGSTGAVVGGNCQGAMTFGPDGLLYGVTLGGTSNGTIFKVTTSGTFTSVRSLNSTLDGWSPYGGLVLYSDGNFYGTTSGATFSASAHFGGTVFKLVPSTSAFTLLSTFPPSAPTYRSLVKHSDGNIYGVTVAGGANGVGSVFKLTGAGALTTLASFALSNGAEPNSLIEGTDGNLYGTCQRGGSNSTGTVFKVSTAGTLTILAHLVAQGQNPMEALTPGGDGNYYGTCTFGGTSGVGTVFRISPAGSITVLGNFTGTTGALLGSSPQTRLVLAGDGNLYGTTNSGGTGSAGTIFRVNVAAGTVTSLVSFTGTSGVAPGITPSSNLLLASDGNFYGTTTLGGANSSGTIYRFTTGGVFTSLVSFTGAAGAVPGSSPFSPLVQGSDGNLYGMTTSGGAASSGTAYRYTLDGTFTSLAAFTGTSGALPGTSPQPMIRQAGDGWFYGTTNAGGPFNLGTIFRFNAAGLAQSLYAVGSSADGGPQNQSNVSMIARACQFVVGNDGYLYGGNGSSIFRVHQQPAVQSVATTLIGTDSATLTASVVPNQDSATVFFQYGTSTAYGSQTSSQALPAGSTSVPVTAALSGLESGVVYHYRLVTVTFQGTFYSPDQTFATYGAPLVITGSYTAVGQTGISCDGLVNPLGDPTLYWFEYGDEAGNYEHQTAPVNAGAGEPVGVGDAAEDPQNASNGIAWLAVRATINLLAPGEVHFRLVASNGYGTSYGEDQTVSLLPAQDALVEPMTLYPGTGTAPQAPLVLSNDGFLYGTTSTGGSSNLGTAFRLSAGGTLTVLANFYTNFTSSSFGSSPQGSLVQAPDGNFYGTTNSGGSGSGTVFRLTPTGIVTTITTFTSTGTVPGANPINGLTVGADGNLYGVAQNGGSNASGTIFRVTPSGAFTSLITFTGTTGAALGASPRGNLLLASDGNFYGTTFSGGASGLGTVFKMTPAGVLTTLVQFTGGSGASPGSAPGGGLIEGNDGNLYGTTSTGGTGNLGTVFMMTPAGTLTTLANFTGSSGATLGSSPKGTLTLGRDGNFYGTTTTGGIGNLGTVFKMTSAGGLTTVVSFTGTSGSAPASSPNGGLVLLADGSFYGTSSAGGLYNAGTIFKVAANGVVSILLNCTPSPVVSKLTQLADGKFYGITTAAGGASGWGTSFSLTQTESPLLLASLPPISGTSPISSRGGFLVTSSGDLWATSGAGGTSNLGSVFKMTPAGVVTTVSSFTGNSGTNPGSSPQAALILGADGNYWGTTSTGGSSGSFGTVFKVTPAGVQTVVVTFTGTTGAALGSSPQAPLLLGSDGNYYGSTTAGGSGGGFGTLFRLTPAGALTTLVNFTGSSTPALGSGPAGPLVQDAAGNIYGATISGGLNGSGTVFQLSPAGILTTLANFTGTTGLLRGTGPTAGLVAGNDGHFYGTTGSGGAYSQGTIFRVASDGNVTSLYSFTGRSDGISPANGGLVLAADGHLHGGNSMGVFRLNPPPVPLSAATTNVLGTSATLNGAVTPEAFGGTVWFEYGSTAAYGQATPAQNFTPGLASVPVTASISGLYPLLTYHYRLVVNCSLGLFAGPDQTFATPNTASFSDLSDVPVTADGFTASGLTLNLSLGFVPARGERLVLVNNVGPNPITGTFNGLPEGSAVTAIVNGTSYLFQISYAGGDGNDVTLTRVDQVIAFPSIPQMLTTDAPYALAATATSGLAVTYEVVAGSAVATVTGSTLTVTGIPGVVTIKATQPGNGSTVGAAPAVTQSFAVVNAISSFVQISASKVNDFVLGIRANGTLWGWGINTSGYLGDGSTTTRKTPVQIGSANIWSSVSAGGSHAVAIRSDGTLWAWGLNTSGQLGNGNTTAQTAPVQIGTVAQLGVSKTWVSATAGTSHSVAIASDGTLWAWGSNSSGQIGQGTTDSLTHSTPTQIGTATTWQSASGALAAGGDFTLALQTDGKLYAWGLNSTNQLGDGTFTTRSVPTLIGSASNWSKVAPASTSAAALRADGTLWTWGSNGSGQLGDGALSSRNSPTQVGNATAWQDLSSGSAHTLARQSDGSLWSWGANSNGQLGQGFADTVARGNVPVRVGADSRWSLLAAGLGVSIATTTDGAVWSWGSVLNGQQGVLPRTLLPLARALGPVAEAFGGNANTIVKRPDGSLLIWGGNSSGQLGLGVSDSAPHPLPTAFGNGYQWRSVSVGAFTVLAVRSDGTLWGCGFNTSSQLGDGSTTSRLSLVQIGMDSDWQSVCTGNTHTLAIKTNGTLWGWGANGSSQLGDGSTTSRSSPVQIGIESNWRTAIATNGSFSVGLKTDGTLWTWGLNTNGQLGDGTTTTRIRPTQVGTETSWASVAAGSSSVLALKTDGTLWAWGVNSFGQLGDGTFTQRNSPVPVGTSMTWRSIAAGPSHSYGITTSGALWSWGVNSSGQLGDGTYSTRNVPTQIGTASCWLDLPSASVSTCSQLLVRAVDGSLWTCGASWLGQTGFAGRNLFVPEITIPALGAPQTMALSASQNASVGSIIALSATASSGLPPNYLVTGPASRDGDNLTITGIGSVTVIAYQPGDSYAQASDIAYSEFTGTPRTNADLQALSLSAGVLSPGFSPSVTSYVVGVSNGTAAFAVTPTAADSAATLKVNSVPVASGISSAPMALALGSNQVNVVVTAQDGTTTKTYGVTVVRPALVSNWRQTFYGSSANSGAAADDADPYHTGVPNLAVFALFGPAQDPARVSVSQLPKAQRSGGNFGLSFNEPSGVSGVVYGAEWTSSLNPANWQPVTDSGSGINHTFNVPIGNNLQMYMRLRITEP